MSEYELGVIGGGNMAEAILRGVTSGGFLSASRIVVSEPVPARRDVLAGATGVTVVDDNAMAACCRRVLLAVKPQMMAKVLEQFAACVPDDALVISIAAGISSVKLDAMLGGRGRIVRVMPNTPMLVGMGMSALAAGPRAGDADLAWASQLFSASGKTTIVEERLIDAVTAVSGSGPAYYFYLIEAMVAAGVAEGLDEKTALMLASGTCAGAAKLLEQSGDKPEVLRAKVTSPGGTTQRAIETLDQAGVKEAMIRAFRACAERSRELGK